MDIDQPLGGLKLVALWMITVAGIAFPPLLLLPAFFLGRALLRWRQDRIASRERWARGAQDRALEAKILRSQLQGTL